MNKSFDTSSTSNANTPVSFRIFVTSPNPATIFVFYDSFFESFSRIVFLMRHFLSSIDSNKMHAPPFTSLQYKYGGALSQPVTVTNPKPSSLLCFVHIQRHGGALPLSRCKWMHSAQIVGIHFPYRLQIL